MENKVLAYKDKKIGIVTSILATLSLALGIWLVTYSLWGIMMIALGLLLAVLGLGTVFSPREVLVVDGENLKVNLLGRQKVIPLTDIEHVSLYENRYNRRNSLFLMFYKEKNDINTVIISYKLNGSLCHLNVLFVLDATAVCASLDLLIKGSK